MADETEIQAVSRAIKRAQERSGADIEAARRERDARLEAREAEDERVRIARAAEAKIPVVLDINGQSISIPRPLFEEVLFVYYETISFDDDLQEKAIAKIIRLLVDGGIVTLRAADG